MTMTEKTLTFEVAIQRTMEALGLSRERAAAALKRAMAAGELPFLVEDLATGKIEPGKPEEANRIFDGFVKPLH